MILLDIEIIDYPYTILNTYFPNADKSNNQIEFINNITEKNSGKTSNLIWGGDMNIHLIPQFDSYQKHNDMPSKPAKLLTGTLEELDLIDI